MKLVKMPGEDRSLDEEVNSIVKEADEVRKRGIKQPDGARQKQLNQFRKKVDELVHREYDDNFKKNSREWVKHKFTALFTSPVHFKVFQKKYESFCSGYLWYYDNILRSQAVDHGIHFQWKHEGGDEYSVRILMDPPPMRGPVPKVPVSKKVKSHESAPLSDEGISVDPPKPPPPPPPSM